MLGIASESLCSRCQGSFLQEAHGDVEGRPAPHLQGEEIGPQIGGRRGDLEQVVGADAGRQEGLVGVAHGGIGDQQPLLLQDPLGQALRPPSP